MHSYRHSIIIKICRLVLTNLGPIFAALNFYLVIVLYFPLVIYILNPIWVWNLQLNICSINQAGCEWSIA